MPHNKRVTTQGRGRSDGGHRPMVIKERSPKLLAVRQATSQETREVAHPQLFGVNVQIQGALYFPR